VISTPIHHFGAMEFGHGCFLGERFMVISQPAGFIEEKTGTFDLEGHVRKFKGVGLER